MIDRIAQFVNSTHEKISFIGDEGKKEKLRISMWEAISTKVLNCCKIVSLCDVFFIAQL